MGATRIAGFLGSVALLALAASPASADMVRIYQTNSGGDDVNVIDPATNKTVGYLKGVEAAHGVTGSPDGSRIYVSNESESTLDVFDAKTYQLVKKVKLSGHPNIITVVDLAKEEIAWELNLGKGVRPMTAEANPDGSTKRLFVQVSELDGARVVDFAQKKEIGKIEVPKLPDRPQFIEHRLDSPSHGIGVSPDNKTLWITSIPQNAVFVYDLADLKLKGHVDLPTINVAGRKPISTVANWVTFTPDGKQIYVSNAANNSVTAIDTAAMKINAVIPVGQAPKRVGTVVTQ